MPLEVPHSPIGKILAPPVGGVHGHPPSRPRTVQRPLCSWVAGAMLVMAILVCSPAFLFLAQSLVITSPLTPADAVVVLGGGVKADGRPQEATLERVLYGATLYHRGLAKRLILSTGAKERISEAQVMAAIARAHEVPQPALLLEEHSRNTYENLREVQQLLSLHHWHTVIMVSSPYHMRRIALVHQKCCKSTLVLYAPAQPAGLYQFGTIRHRFWQANAGLHEYLGLGWDLLHGYL